MLQFLNDACIKTVVVGMLRKCCPITIGTNYTMNIIEPFMRKGMSSTEPDQHFQELNKYEFTSAHRSQNSFCKFMAVTVITDHGTGLRSAHQSLVNVTITRNITPTNATATPQTNPRSRRRRQRW